jgi:hypothetical protein
MIKKIMRCQLSDIYIDKKYGFMSLVFVAGEFNKINDNITVLNIIDYVNLII